MKNLLYTITFLMTTMSWTQTVQDSINNPQNQINAAQRILTGNINSGVTVGGYGEITYNQPEGSNGELDVQRLVLLFGYKFSDKVQFVTEIELEHVEEVFVEQAFINYSVAENVNLRGGLMLVPMGIVNEYHEPTTFNGVERPGVDSSIIPTTWREIGVGVYGRFDDISLGYQAYVFNGFKSTATDDTDVMGFIGGSSGLRGGRQKGIQSTINSPTFSTKLDYYGITGLRLGLAGYFGKTQPEEGLEDIDGSAVGISMIGFDARYSYHRFSARGQYVYASLSDTEAYNDLTGQNLGSALQGYYIEGAYNLLPEYKKQKLVAFVRYENYDTHAKTDGILVRNDAYNRTDVTTGLSYHIVNGVVVKADYQFRDNALSGSDVDNRLNFGIGFWF